MTSILDKKGVVVLRMYGARNWSSPGGHQFLNMVQGL
jgi:hypothetical protein